MTTAAFNSHAHAHKQPIASLSSHRHPGVNCMPAWHCWQLHTTAAGQGQQVLLAKDASWHTHTLPSLLQQW
jgi:hypothetical protein